MNSITELRRKLGTDLQASGWTVHLAPPKSGRAPALIMRTPASRYLVPGSTFSQDWRLRVDLALFVPNGDHEDATEQLDDLMVKLLDELPDEWDVEQSQGVSGLFLLQLGSNSYPAQIVALSALVQPSRN